MNNALKRVKNKYFALASILAILFSITAALGGTNGFDEVIQFYGLEGIINHGKDSLLLRSPDFNNIHANLEYYGIALRLPAYFAWACLNLLRQVLDPLGNLGIAEHSKLGLPDAFASGFFEISHIFSTAYLIIAGYIAILFSRKLGIKKAQASGVAVILLPTLLGFSIISVKDTAFAAAYFLYSLSLARVHESERAGSSKSRRKQLAIHYLIAGLLISIYTTGVIVVLISQAAFLANKAGRLKSISKKDFLTGIRGTFRASMFCTISWLIFTPQAWSNPIHFAKSSLTFTLDASKAWGGCTTLLGTCMRNDKNWNFLHYASNWIFLQLPLLLIIGLLFSAISAIKRAFDLSLRLAKQREIQENENGFLFRPYQLAITLQLSLIPTGLALTNGFIFDSTRHLLFIFPPLTVIACWGLNQANRALTKTHLLLPATIMTLGLCFTWGIDLALLHPYQYTYLNEAAHARGISWKNTDMDYYFASDAESLRNYMRSDHYRSTLTQGGINIKGAPGMEIAFHRQGFLRRIDSDWFFTNHARQPGETQKDGCIEIAPPVTRKQLLGHKNVYGTPNLCPRELYSGWKPF